MPGRSDSGMGDAVDVMGVEECGEVLYISMLGRPALAQQAWSGAIGGAQ